MGMLKKIWAWFEDRAGLSPLIEPLLKHPVPPECRWLYVFGSAALFAFILQIVTGVTLATLYVSSSGGAYQSLEYLTHEAPFGGWLRGMHYWGASAMILFAGVHLIRVYLSGSYKFPRELNWITGVLLLGLTVGMGFTGQVMRWDQNALWSVVVGANQAGRSPFIGKYLARLFMGGPTLSSNTLSQFFVIHVFVLPGLLLAVIGLHLRLVLRNGISEPPRSGRPVDPQTYRSWYESMIRERGTPFFPNAAWRDAVFAVAMIIGVALLGLFIGAPALSRPPDPSIVEAMPRPDWYMLWYFAVLALLPHGAENYVILLGPLLAGVVLISLPFLFPRGERSPRRRPWSVLIVFMALTFIGVLWLEALRAPWSPHFDAKPLPVSVIGADSGPVYEGGELFHSKACIYCHTISGHGGDRGPNLTEVAGRLTRNQMIIRILNGGYNMPAYGGILQAAQLEQLLDFLRTRHPPGEVAK